jgi:hypothetical protein
MFAGLCLAMAGLALSFWLHLCASRYIVRFRVRASTARRLYEERQDCCQGVLWFGLVLVSASQISAQLSRGVPLEKLALSLAAGAAVTFACGFFAGRLHLRRQRQREIAAEAMEDGDGRGGADQGALGQ